VAISEVGTTSGKSLNTKTLSFNHTTTAATDILIVGCGAWRSGGTTFSSAKFNAVAMTLLGTTINADDGRVAIYYMLATDLPTAGTYSVEIVTAAKSEQAAGAANFSGVDQTTPFRASSTAIGNSTSPSTTVSSSTTDLLIAASNFWNTDPTMGTGVTQVHYEDNNAGLDSMVMFKKAGASGTPTIDISIGSTFWGIVAGSMQEAAASTAEHPYIKRFGGVPFVGNPGVF